MMGRVWCLLLLWVWLPVETAAVPSLPQPVRALITSDGHLTWTIGSAKGDRPLFRSLGFEAVFADGSTAFKTEGVRSFEGWNNSHLIRFNLTGQAGDRAEVLAEIRKVPRGVLMRWIVRYRGEPKGFFPWRTGFTLDFASPPEKVFTRSTIRWVRPAGRYDWEVPGDMPYPDFECQIRRVRLQGRPSIALVTHWYDGDWIYGNDIGRARFMRAGLPKESPSETTFTFAILRAERAEDEDLAAIAQGHPLSIRLSTGRVGNLFQPGEPIAMTLRVAKVSGRPLKVDLSCQIHDYYGSLVANTQKRLFLTSVETRLVSLEIPYRRRGILFATAKLHAGPWEREQWQTLGVLPGRPLRPPDSESPFGLAGFIADPGSYPDQPRPETLLPLAQRIGVRWVRSCPFPVKASFTPEEEREVQERVALFRRYGLSFHPQIGIDITQRSAWQDELRATLSKFRWVSDYIELGNELNPQNASEEQLRQAAADYVERILKPFHAIMRQAHPKGKVMNHGLGGVWLPYLEGMEKAGAFGLLDVLSVHPGFQPRAPEFYEGWKGWVFHTQMEDAMLSARRHHKPVWITEVYAPTPPDRSAVDLRTSADYLVRIHVLAMAMGVQVIEWYQFQDGVWFARVPNPKDPEHNFGILYTDLSPKPAYLAYGVMTELLEGLDCMGRLPLGADDLYRVCFAKGQRAVDVLWSYRERHETDLAWWPPEQFKDKSRRPGMPWETRWQKPVRIQLPADRPILITDIMGNCKTARPKNGSVTLWLSGSPIFVSGLRGAGAT